MLKSNNNENNLSSLFKKVHALNFDNVKNLNAIKTLLNDIYSELSIFKKKNKSLVLNNSINEKLYAKYEAEDILL